MNIDELKLWALSLGEPTKPLNGIGNFYTLKQLKNVPKEVQEKRQLIIKEYGLSKTITEYNIGDCLIVLRKNDYVNKHTDDIYEGFNHIRYNWVLSATENGGNLIVGNNATSIISNDIIKVDTWIEHSIDKIKGELPTIIFSFGFLVNEWNFIKG